MAKKAQNLESNMAELEAILETIASEQTPLDEAIELYAKAAKLIELCNAQLKNAGVRMDEIDQKIGQMELSDGV